MALLPQSEDDIDLIEDISTMEAEVPQEFVPREYQLELFHCALEQNTIVYLPTGSGKTFIAAMLIKEKGDETNGSVHQGGKRTVFLVPTVALAIQQAAYLRRHTYLKVKEYFGSMNVDFWGKDRWLLEFENNQVLVMTAQIFVDILNHAFFPANQVNLLVFDECHAAVKDSPMKQALAKINTIPEHKRPKILGLTAALFRKKCRPGQVHNVISKLTSAMNCVIKTPSDFDHVQRHSTNPCMVILEYASKSLDASPETTRLSDKIREIAKNLLSEFTATYRDGQSRDDVLLNAPKRIFFLLDYFGIYGVYHNIRVYLKVLPRYKERARLSEAINDFSKLISACNQIIAFCEAEFAYYKPSDRLLKFVHPRVHRLLTLLRSMNPGGVKEPEKHAKMCAIVFVDRRDTANVLYHFLKEVSEVDAELKFINPLFTMGQAAGRSNILKESSILNKRQQEIMTEFRNGTCNLLVATSVLEEGIDIPACNLIIRFDQTKTYCDYVQAKGRARAKNSFYVLMTGSEAKEEYFDELLQYHAIEVMLMKQKDGSIWERAIDDKCETLEPPYAPFGANGPRITTQSSISLVNRYCATLSIDPQVPLVAKFEIKAVDPNEVPRAWLKKIDEALGSLSLQRTEESGLYQCSLALPLNSPLREIVVGAVMPSKRLAKRSAALKACQLLHELQEFDDVHLLPKSRVACNDDDDDVDEEERVTDVLRKNKYPRDYPDGFNNCRPVPGSATYIYAINFKLVEPNELHKNFLPGSAATRFAIASSKRMPALCAFPMDTKGGKVEISIEELDSVVLDQVECSLLESFHEFLFKHVIYLFKQQLEFRLGESLVQCLLVPLNSQSKAIDYDFACRMVTSPKVDWETRPKIEHFDFKASQYEDAVVVPWYRPFNNFMIFYVDCVTSLTPLSKFPDSNKVTYRSYFANKYEYDIVNNDQSLVSVVTDIPHKNFLLPRPATTKVDDETHLVPEMCHLHPCPASVWKQAVWLPSILQRVYNLLNAEQIRLKIYSEMKEPKIGLACPPVKWPPLSVRNQRDDKQRPVSRPETSKTIRKTDGIALDDIVDLMANEEMLWLVDCHRSDSLASGAKSPARDRTKSDETVENVALTLQKSTRTNEMKNMSFDKLAASQQYGPSPGQILEALTVTRTSEGFDMERYEAIGDSILKLVTSIYVQGQYEDEGQLTSQRKKQICNKNLAKIGKARGLASRLSTHQFKLTENFLAPGFLAPPAEGDVPNAHLEQNITEKNIADNVEALIGVYLVTNGIKGALGVMQWLGLNTSPADANFNETNGLAVLEYVHLPIADPNDRAPMLTHLFDGFEEFEKQLGYRFNTKELLIEAFTHPSYFGNRLTHCYQKLEFLGDSVLDYLVTKFFYEDPSQFSPGVLTDLRSAMVNNETFAVIAVRNGFHRYLKYESQSLSAALDRFCRIQEDNGHAPIHDNLEFEEINDEKVARATGLEVPKVLGDIFESVAGAIFIDSNMSLDAVWRVYLPLLNDELENFSAVTPLAPVRELHDKYNQDVKFKDSIQLEDGRRLITVAIGARSFKGVGANSKLAKAAAAKFALRELSETKTSI